VTKATLLTTAGVVTVVGSACCLVALVALHLLPTGLSPLTNPVSQYGITRYRAGYRVQTIAMGIAALATAVGVAELAISSAGLVVGLFVVFGLARLAISWFPMDAPGTTRTETGRRHGLLALAAFGGATLATLRLGTALERGGLWGGARSPLVGLGVAMAICLLAMGTARRTHATRRYFGLIERAFYAGALAALLVVGIELIRTR
jgi:Protein of unknown function (DUF998)